MRTPFSWRLFLPAFLFAAVLAGCEEDVLTSYNPDRPFSLYGVLNPLADTQFVRVFEVEPFLSAGRPQPLDARFVSRELETGEERVWSDSILVGASDVVGHVFHAPFRPKFEHTYEISVTHGDGRSSHVKVQIPPRTVLHVADPDTTRGVWLSAELTGDASNLIRTSIRANVSFVMDVIVVGPMQYPVRKFIWVDVPFERSTRTANGWLFSFDLSDVYEPVSERVRSDSEFREVLFNGIALHALQFSALIANEEWRPPDGKFDWDALSQPGVMSNVENGFGFVGGGYRNNTSWTLPRNAVRMTPFQHPNDVL
jgi:hypothetical protein